MALILADPALPRLDMISDEDEEELNDEDEDERTSCHQSVCCYRELLAATCGLLSYTSQTGRHYD